MGKASRVRKQRKEQGPTARRRLGVAPVSQLALGGVSIDGAPTLGGGVVYYDDEAHALLTGRGWLGNREEMEGDSWEWPPSEVGETEYVSPTWIWTEEVGFSVDGPSLGMGPDSSRHRVYLTLEELVADLDEIEGWRVRRAPA